MKRSGPLERRTRLRPVSRKKQRERATRRAIVADAFARAGNRCAAVGLFGIRCSGPLDPHEIIPRSVWPGGYLVTSNVVPLCRAHHDHVTDHELEARPHGLHGYSWERPSTTDG